MIIGLDMGGTHIDGVIIKDGEIISKVKNPTNKEDLFQSIWFSLESLLSGHDKKQIKRINLSTTVSTNAIIEKNTSPVGMIIQSGPGINHDFLSCGDENIFVSGYIDHRGKLVQDLNRDEIKNAGLLFHSKNIKACGVVTKFSTRNPSNEIKIKELLGEDFSSISMGHSLSGKLNFPRRVYTSYLNAAVYDTFKNFSQNIKKSLKKEGVEAPLFILKADGGTMDIKTAEIKPVETILSGPAASLMGMKALLINEEDSILLDVGGTTTDIFFLADGDPLFQPLGIKIGSYNTLVRSIYSSSIGLGGDSAIRIDNGRIKIGPERKGKAMAFGGLEPTPTDAMITLGHIDDGDRKKSLEAMKALGAKIGMNSEEISIKILNTFVDTIKNKVDDLLIKINGQPVYTVKQLLHGKTIKAKQINIIGGPANILAPLLEEKFNLPTYYPKNFNIANAIGAALARPTLAINMIADTERKTLSVPELNLYENISSDFNLEDAKLRARELIREAAISMGSDVDEIETDILEESSFNMVRGYITTGRNIRVKAQIKPGLIQDLRSDVYDES